MVGEEFYCIIFWQHTFSKGYEFIRHAIKKGIRWLIKEPFIDTMDPLHTIEQEFSKRCARRWYIRKAWHYRPCKRVQFLYPLWQGMGLPALKYLKAMLNGSKKHIGILKYNPLFLCYITPFTQSLYGFDGILLPYGSILPSIYKL